MPSHTPCTRCNRSCNRLDNQLHLYTQLYSNIVTLLLFCMIIIFEVTIANFKHLFSERYVGVFKTLFLFSEFWRFYCSLECTRNNCSTHDDVTSLILDSLAVLARPFPIHLSTEFGPYIEARCGGLRHRRLRGSCQFSVRRAAVQTLSIDADAAPRRRGCGDLPTTAASDVSRRLRQEKPLDVQSLIRPCEQQNS